MSNYVPLLAAMIEFIGALIITAAAISAMFVLARRKSIRKAKIHIASGAITGLDFKLAATLLKALALLSWESIGMFASIYAIRIVLKQAFHMEQKI
jgi:uncharacterized membrane protein